MESFPSSHHGNSYVLSQVFFVAVRASPLSDGNVIVYARRIKGHASLASYELCVSRARLPAARLRLYHL